MPLQYITNEQEFMKLKFYVDENVLIPQPDTEILVEQIINDYKEKEVKILDLCTGSGAIAISLAKYIKKSIVTATDISNKALQIAKLNAEKNLCHTRIKFMLSDMFANIENGKNYDNKINNTIENDENLNKKINNNKDKILFDVIASNPPYIKTDVIKKLDITVQNEPILALDGGKDGLKFYKIIAENAYKFLNENGRLYLEIGYDQKQEVIGLLEKTNKYENIICIQDLAGNDRVIIAKKIKI